MNKFAERLKSCCIIGVFEKEESTNNPSNNLSVSTHTHHSAISRTMKSNNNNNNNKTTSTFENQSSLPRLPIPDLNDTLSRFTETVRPLLTPTQLEQTQATILNFLANEGPELHTKLQEYDAKGAKDASIGSYIEEFWNDAYLVPETSVVLNLNPFFLLEEDADAKIAKDQIKRASALAFYSLKLAASLKNETMTPDVIKGTKLCMDQFRSLFGSCRIPASERDYVEVDRDSSHVVVLYQNQFYYFRGLWPRSTDDEEVKVAVNESDIAQMLKTIVDDAKKTPKAESVEHALGGLTTLPRNHWADIRKQLITVSGNNKSSLEVLSSALFVLVLDDFTPANVSEAAANMLHGTHKMALRSSSSNKDSSNHNDEVSLSPKAYYQAGTCCNRFYDKLQLIVCEDGSAGINFEHSAIDGHTALRFASDVFAETIVTFAQSITKSIYTGGCPVPNLIDAKVVRAALMNQGKKVTDTTYLDTNPKKLTFDVVEKIQEQIFFAEMKLGDAISSDDTYVLEFKNFGKNYIVANKFSPDSIVQMSIVLTYYRLYGEIVSAYEPVLTKRYYHGRTEAMRTTTTETVQLCKTWFNRFSSKEEKINALRKATQNHSKLVKQSSDGNGVDRHLYALKCIAEKNGLPTPELFNSDAWKALNHTILSTSNCGNPALKLFGFGPVVNDGFGIGYIIKDSGLQYSISSKHRQTKRYAMALNETLTEMEKLLGRLSSQQLGCHKSESINIPSKKVKSTVRSNIEFPEGYDIYGEGSYDNRSEMMNKTNSSASMASTASLVGRSTFRKNSVRLNKIGNELQNKTDDK